VEFTYKLEMFHQNVEALRLFFYTVRKWIPFEKKFRHLPRCTYRQG